MAVGSGDIDRDGDPDPVVVGDHDVTFAPNQGGQFSISAWAEPDVQLPVPHGPVNPPIIPGQREYFFVVAEMTDDASAASPSCFQTRHMAGGTVTALRYDLYDINPNPSWFPSVEGGLVCAGAFGIFADGFEAVEPLPGRFPNETGRRRDLVLGWRERE